eukprot:CAMPEP_0117500052 /NCGR_PEP_ID=MMETSP0784-20121206/22572_1 /TAXON_ID=39447 /ORGANISM="" /LENGTH=308 /DNA_ID=CAMNT_0005295239 /DNA_START=182 /DNA_END=1108 /DNA_ORIENTATION=-
MPVRLSWPQHGALEVVLMHAIWPQLRLQADGAELLPFRALAMPPTRRAGARNVASGKDLEPWLVGPHLHRDLVRADEARCQHRLAALGHVEAVVAVNGPACVDGLLQDLRRPQVQERPCDLVELPRDGQRRVRSRSPRGNDHEGVVQDVPGLVAFQVPIGVVRHAQQSRLISHARILEVKLASAKLIGDRDPNLSRVAHRAVWLDERQHHPRLRRARHVEDLREEALSASVEVVVAIVPVELVSLSIQLEGPVGDAVSAAADCRTEVGFASVNVSLERLVPQHNVQPLAVDPQAHGNECGSEAADIHL